jgi:hypothetical protein
MNRSLTAAAPYRRLRAAIRSLAPEELDEDGQHSAVHIVCFDCLVDDDPEIGPGLDVAREWGAADLDENGEWVGRLVEEDAEE